jgi:hypothetical protein
MEEVMDVASADISFASSLATEMKMAVERSVECWMAEVDCALTDPRLTTLGRLYAVERIVEQYKTLTGKTTLTGRTHDS